MRAGPQPCPTAALSLGLPGRRRGSSSSWGFRTRGQCDLCSAWRLRPAKRSSAVSARPRSPNAGPRPGARHSACHRHRENAALCQPHGGRTAASWSGVPRTPPSASLPLAAFDPCPSTVKTHNCHVAALLKPGGPRASGEPEVGPGEAPVALCGLHLPVGTGSALAPRHGAAARRCERAHRGRCTAPAADPVSPVSFLPPAAEGVSPTPPPGPGWGEKAGREGERTALQPLQPHGRDQHQPSAHARHRPGSVD